MEPGPRALRALARSALAATLALLLLAVATLSASQVLHSALHSDGGVNTHFCLACSLVKGQLDAVEAVIAIVLVLAVSLSAFFPETGLALPDPAYFLSPSRAPPRS